MGRPKEMKRDSAADIVRDAGAFGPLFLKNTDATVVAATAAPGMRMVVAHGCMHRRGDACP